VGHQRHAEMELDQQQVLHVYNLLLSFSEEGEKRIVKPYSEREDFWQFYAPYRHQHRTVSLLFLA